MGKNLAFVARVPGRTGDESESEKLVNEMMTKKSPNLAKDLILKIQEAEKMPNRINSKTSIPENITAM